MSCSPIFVSVHAQAPVRPTAALPVIQSTVHHSCASRSMSCSPITPTTVLCADRIASLLLGDTSPSTLTPSHTTLATHTSRPSCTRTLRASVLNLSGNRSTIHSWLYFLQKSSDASISAAAFEPCGFPRTALSPTIAVASKRGACSVPPIRTLTSLPPSRLFSS
eukprot:CAMPEP_0206230326 /NCGR_PEP_ID=MMETSP0047_2-20121206/10196_1 /ASSEMBLY_ACC=CAM_ASM_000192 /TAXON_ID=195065 /ORGANISM="Chroomonas mesostigmatica_cf, Strain CCMP1168" /LENGTH=163 /DNA_ID=CAMNT_0053653735 /DNA_START=188 /DNA_END=679 /DNA_ORIENTATION=-